MKWSHSPGNLNCTHFFTFEAWRTISSSLPWNTGLTLNHVCRHIGHAINTTVLRIINELLYSNLHTSGPGNPGGPGKPLKQEKYNHISFIFTSEDQIIVFFGIKTGTFGHTKVTLFVLTNTFKNIYRVGEADFYTLNVLVSQLWCTMHEMYT